MSKLTLLEIVQAVASAIDADPVNDINDTPEAAQIAQITKDVYYELINRKDWMQHKTLFRLTASGDNDYPCLMTIPATTKEIFWIQYNKRASGDTRDKYSPVNFMLPEDFIELVNARDDNDSDVTQMTHNNVEINILSDTAPTYWTTFDDENIIFDSYDSDVDTTLQTSKIQVYGIQVPTWTAEDSFTPDLPIDGFPLLLAEVKSVASLELKQRANSKAEQQSKRQSIKMAQHHWNTVGGVTYPDYGRKRP